MHWLRPEWSYDQTVAEARRRIRDDRERGGGYGGFAKVNEAILREHVTADRRKGARCLSCDQPWPCPSIVAIFAAD